MSKIVDVTEIILGLGSLLLMSGFVFGGVLSHFTGLNINVSVYGANIISIVLIIWCLYRIKQGKV